MELTEMAMRYKALGFSGIGLREGKVPLGKWKPYQQQIASDEALLAMMGNQNCKGIAVVCGRVSGGLEVIDIDCKYDLAGTLYEDYVARVVAADAGLWTKLVVVRTVNGGYHAYYRCAVVQGNMKLAARPTTAAEQAANPADKTRVLIETRGEGGYIVAPPSHGYTFVQGRPEDVCIITPQEREVLLSAAREGDLSPTLSEGEGGVVKYLLHGSPPSEGLGEVSAPSPSERAGERYPSERAGERYPERPSVFDEYNEHGDVVGLLQSHGWKVVSETAEKVIMLRPGDTTSISSGDYNKRLGWFGVFTTSSVFIPNKAYLPYAVFAVLECGGDFHVAAARLKQWAVAVKGGNWVKEVKEVNMGNVKNMVEGHNVAKGDVDGTSDSFSNTISMKEEEKATEEEKIKIEATCGEEEEREEEEEEEEKADDDNSICAFWAVGRKSKKITLLRNKLEIFLSAVGGFYLHSYGGKTNGLIRIVDGVVTTADAETIKKFVKKYILSLPPRFDRIKREVLLEVVYRSAQTLFRDEFFEFLERREVLFLKDTATHAYLPFKNGVACIDATGYELKTYAEVGMCVWASSIIDRDFDMGSEHPSRNVTQSHQGDAAVTQNHQGSHFDDRRNPLSICNGPHRGDAATPPTVRRFLTGVRNDGYYVAGQGVYGADAHTAAQGSDARLSNALPPRCSGTFVPAHRPRQLSIISSLPGSLKEGGELSCVACDAKNNTSLSSPPSFKEGMSAETNVVADGGGPTREGETTQVLAGAHAGVQGSDTTMPDSSNGDECPAHALPPRCSETFVPAHRPRQLSIISSLPGSLKEGGELSCVACDAKNNTFFNSPPSFKEGMSAETNVVTDGGGSTREGETTQVLADAHTAVQGSDTTMPDSSNGDECPAHALPPRCSGTFVPAHRPRQLSIISSLPGSLKEGGEFSCVACDAKNNTSLSSPPSFKEGMSAETNVVADGGGSTREGETTQVLADAHTAAQGSDTTMPDSSNGDGNKKDKTPPAQFFRFMQKIAGDEPQRIRQACALVGYLLHGYKNPTRPWAVVLCEEVANSNSGGGAGKGIFVKALSYLRRTVVMDGKNFKLEKSFAWQRVTIDTQLVAIEDVRRGIDFEGMNSILTEGITIERKNRDELYVPFADAPKFIFSTNYTIPAASNHAKRRMKLLEFSPFFYAGRRPDEYFGGQLFYDWDEAEWQRFYHFMCGCVMHYLRHGVPELTHSVALKNKQTAQRFGDEFVTWWDEYAHLKIKNEKEEIVTVASEWKLFSELYNGFLTENGYDKKDYSQKRFKQAMEETAKLWGGEVVTRRNRQEGTREVQLQIKDNPVHPVQNILQPGT